MPNEYSIQCEIDDNLLRMRYQLRLVKENWRNPWRKSNEILIPQTADGHYQNGLYCYRAHGLRNLRSFNITTTSVVIGWSFYTWDIPLIRSMEVQVNQGMEKLIQFVVKTGPKIDQHQERFIGGLKGCTHYTIFVGYDYSFIDRRRENLSVSTICPEKGNTVSESHSFGPLVIIILCSALLVLGIFFLIYFLQRALHRYRTRQNREVVVIDMNNLIMAID